MQRKNKMPLLFPRSFVVYFCEELLGCEHISFDTTQDTTHPTLEGESGLPQSDVPRNRRSDIKSLHSSTLAILIMWVEPAVIAFNIKY